MVSRFTLVPLLIISGLICWALDLGILLSAGIGVAVVAVVQLIDLQLERKRRSRAKQEH
jgi:hypothetical protein